MLKFFQKVCGQSIINRNKDHDCTCIKYLIYELLNGLFKSNSYAYNRKELLDVYQVEHIAKEKRQKHIGVTKCLK